MSMTLSVSMSESVWVKDVLHIQHGAGLAAESFPLQAKGLRHRGQDEQFEAIAIERRARNRLLENVRHAQGTSTQQRHHRRSGKGSCTHAAHGQVAQRLEFR